MVGWRAPTFYTHNEAKRSCLYLFKCKEIAFCKINGEALQRPRYVLTVLKKVKNSVGISLFFDKYIKAALGSSEIMKIRGWTFGDLNKNIFSL